MKRMKVLELIKSRENELIFTEFGLDVYWARKTRLFRKRMSIILAKRHTELALAAKAKCIMRNDLGSGE